MSRKKNFSGPAPHAKPTSVLMAEQAKQKRADAAFDEMMNELPKFLDPDAALIAKAERIAAQQKRDRKLAWAKGILSAQEHSRDGGQRRPIPKEIRYAVFNRDGGRCVECGSNFDLHFDHVIPLAMGGGSTVENLQLLCADCNLRKGATLG
jgi:hypothetical protein